MMKVVAFVAAVLLAASSVTAMAANADQPYSNVDKRNDAGNDTGNAKVESLNRDQLDQNQGSATRTPPPAPAPQR